MIRWVKLLAVVRMPGMRIVRRNHEGTLHCLIIRLLRSALCKGDALQHIREERTSRTLLGLRTRLLIVENRQHLGSILGISRRQSLYARPAHRQIIESSRRDKLIVHTEGAGRSGISQIEIEVEDIFFLDIQFAGNHVHQQITLFQFIVDDAEDREHILLLTQLHAIVHLAVEVDSEIADLQQRSLDMEQERLRMHRILALYDHSTRQSEWTVEPG